MKTFAKLLAVALVAAVVAPVAVANDEENITKALPAKPTAKPKKARKLLIYSKASGFKHKSIGAGKVMLKLLGEKTGAYTPVFNDNADEYTADYLKQFDAVFFNNTTHVQKAFKTPEQKKALLDYIKNGGGFGGLHSASDAGGKGWPEYTEMIGGRFNGHPWNAGGTWSFDNEDPKHPLARAFQQQFKIKDEIYKQQDYDRSKLRVLVTINAERSGKKGRPDNDNPVVWVRDYGKGRVFYSNFGHNKEVFFDKAMLQHYLDGIQFSLGDLEMETKSIPKAK